ncbi:hypothetical protein DP939_02795 [Spongiactinospora rosea]|uniref:Uncharacterized protein n=1 Tax=Spongiactinospora rosea TaxID=2248750 RepID=A0A366M625_9ACTN|nr:hypothetical protein DP939_02795 [Spongiactinospora rosea]
MLCAVRDGMHACLDLGSRSAGIAAIGVDTGDSSTCGHEAAKRLIFETMGGSFWVMPIQAAFLYEGGHAKATPNVHGRIECQGIRRVVPTGPSPQRRARARPAA